MNISEKLLFYAVTDRKEQTERQFLQNIESALKGGITLLQFREKNLQGEAFLILARKVKELADFYGVPLIINDNVEAAKIIDASGVHLGQEDIKIEQARALLGADKIIGGTAKTKEQALSAQKQGADYLGCGSIFPSHTKSAALKMEIATLSEICSVVNIPVCAIGGIDINNVDMLFDSGIAGVAVCGGIFDAAPEEIETKTKEFACKLKKFFEK